VSALISDVDHLMCGVADPQKAGETFEKLGFTVSPLSVIPAFGLANRCVLLTPRTADRANYLELLGIVDPPKVSPTMTTILAGPEGVKSLVMVTSDARAASEELTTQGYQPSPPLYFERQWALSPHETLNLSFTVVIPRLGQAPLPWNLCQHHTVRHFHRSDLQQHPNGALRLVGVTSVSSEPATTVRYYERLLAVPARRNGDESFTVSPGEVEIRIISPSAFSQQFPEVTHSPQPPPPYVAGFTIAVRDLTRTESQMHTAGVTYARTPQGTRYVTPSTAHGLLIEFTETKA